MGSAFSAEEHITSEQQQFAKDLRYLLTETAGEELVKTIDNLCPEVPKSTTTEAKTSTCPATETPARNLLFTQDIDLLSFPVPIILQPLSSANILCAQHRAVSDSVLLTKNLQPAIPLSLALSVPRDKGKFFSAHKPLADIPTRGGVVAQSNNSAVLRNKAPAPTVPLASKPVSSYSTVLIPGTDVVLEMPNTLELAWQGQQETPLKQEAGCSPLKQARYITEELNGDSGSSLPCELGARHLSHPAGSYSQAGVFVVQEIKGPPGRQPSSAQLPIDEGQRLQVHKAPDPVDSLGQTDNVDSVPTHDSAFRAAYPERAWEEAVTSAAHGPFLAQQMKGENFANAAVNPPVNVTFDMLGKKERFATCKQEATLMDQAVTQCGRRRKSSSPRPSTQPEPTWIPDLTSLRLSRPPLIHLCGPAPVLKCLDGMGVVK